MQELLGSTTFWYFLSFSVFAVAGYRVGAGAIVALLDKRIQEIKKKLETAENLKVEAQELLAQYQRKQRDAAKDAEQIIEDAKRNAARIRQQAESDLDASMARRERIMEERMERMQQNAVSEIQRHAAELAVRVARHMIREKLENNPDARMVEESVRSVSSRLRQ